MKSILLLAGLSRRCGDVNKLLKNFGASPLFSYSLTACLENTDTIVVLGHECEKVRKAVDKFINANNFEHNIKFVENPRYKSGQFSSIIAGISALDGSEDFCIALGDTPQLTVEKFAFIQSNFLSMRGEYDCLQPFCDSVPAHPVFCRGRIREFALRHADETDLTFSSLLSLEKISTKRLQLPDNMRLLREDVDFLEDFK